MQKRKLTLDKELLTSSGPRAPDGGRLSIGSILSIFTLISDLEPNFCDCLDSDSCASAACETNQGTECIPADDTAATCISQWQGCSMNFC